MLGELHRREKLTSGEHADISKGIALSVDLSPDPTGPARGLMGYRARRNTGVVDVDKPASCATGDFWEPLWVQGSKNRLILDPDQFYILASKEAVHVPPTHAAEMVPFNPLVGEFRVHYAGFCDPGFGHAAAGGQGARAVLEVRSREVPFILEHGQIVGRLVYERMTERPITLYGETPGSNYQAQGLKEKEIDAQLQRQVVAAGQRQAKPSSLLSFAPDHYRRLVDPYDARQGLEERARSFLHSNCAACHVEAGGGNAQMELEFTTPREKMRVLDVKPVLGPPATR